MDITALVSGWVEDLSYQAEELGLSGNEERLWVTAQLDERFDTLLDLHQFGTVLADIERLGLDPTA